MKSLLFRLLPLLAFTFALALAPLRADDDPRTPHLKTADDERVAATISADRSKLTAIFSDDLRYAHSSGTVDTKASYMDALTSGRTKYVSIEYQERNFTFPAPKIALMTGRAQVEVAKDDGKTVMILAFLGVWREENGQWRFLAWQSCKLPDAAAGTGAAK